MRSLLAFFSALFLSLPAFAQTPQLTLTGSLSNPAPHHGETVRLDMKLRNDGPSRVTSLWIDVALDNAIVLESRTGLCHLDSRPGAFRCATGEVPAGTEVDLPVDVRFSNSASFASIAGEIETFIYSPSSSAETRHAEWSFELEVPITPLALRSDVAVTMSHEPLDLPLDEPAILRTTISNFGPDSASDILLYVDSPLGPDLPPDLQGATCHDTDFWGRYECTIPFLAAGSQVVIEHSMPPESTPTNWRRGVLITFPDRTDSDGSNNRVESLLRVGSGQVATVLIPLVIQPTEGAHGSRWVSEVSVYADVDEETFFYPLLFICRITCPGPPVSLSHLPPKKRLPLGEDLWALDGFPGYVLHFDRRKAGEISFTHRIRDVSREHETWGTEVPIVQAEDFPTGRTQLIDVASGPRYRQTLRLYRPDGGPGAMTVRVYGERGSETLIAEQTVPLAVPPQYDAGTHASYAQIDLHSAFPDTVSYDRLRIEIEPASGDPEYWAFVSITNNDTQHVTLVTPQLGGRSE